MLYFIIFCSLFSPHIANAQEAKPQQNFKYQGSGTFSAFCSLNAWGPPIPLISSDNRYSPGYGASTPSFTENKVNISAPAYKSEKDTVSLSLAGGQLNLGKTVTLNSGTQVPRDLYRIELGTQYFYRLPDQKSWGLKVSTGYAGDKPFKNNADMSYTLNANYSFKGSEKGYWIFSVYFSNNSPLGNYIPIPGVNYLYKTDTFTGLFGLPATALQWTPVAPWYFSLGFFGPNLQSEIGYGTLDEIQFFTGYYWSTQSYIPSQRSVSSYRLIIEEMKASLGVRSVFFSKILGEIQFGQAFNRSIYIGNYLFNHAGGFASLNDELFMSAGIKARL